MVARYGVETIPGTEASAEVDDIEDIEDCV
jgi:hypothetical protein